MMPNNSQFPDPNPPIGPGPKPMPKLDRKPNVGTINPVKPGKIYAPMPSKPGPNIIKNLSLIHI